jgi:predicted metal-binding membrane protein
VPVGDAVPPQPWRDRGTLLTGAMLVVLVGLAWTVLLSRPAGAVRGPGGSPFWGDPLAYVALAGPRSPNPPPALLAAAAIAGPPALAVASFLTSWALLVLAVVLPAAVPTLAAYGAAHRARFGTTRAAPHAVLFALAAAGLWLMAGLAVHLASLAVAAGRGATAAPMPYLLALGLGAVAFYRLSPADDACRVATRRPAAVWARRAAPGYRGTLAVGWAHAVGSVGAGAALVTVLALGGAASPWAIVVAVLLVAERVLPRPEPTGLVASGVLLALAGAAAVWPAPALAALRWTIP